ncbi:MAG: glutamine amidotransferase [Planctomycetota bacterium]|nr:glutamine amidotransferase [Planctomycetota bacterium]
MKFRSTILRSVSLLLTFCILGLAYPEPPDTPRRLPRILAVQGLWNEHYRLPEALSMAGGADLKESLHFHGGSSSGLHFLKGEGQWGFPGNAEQMSAFDLLVLTNVAARSFSDEQTEMIEDYIKQGGGLLLLGGYWTLDKGGMRGTTFERILPVTIPGNAARLPHVPQGMVLQPAREHLVTGLVDWSAKPVTFFHHRLIPRPDAMVLVNGGEHPILITGQYGKGRTAVFAGTVNGEPPKDIITFWQWRDWPQLLANIIEWLISPEQAVRSPNKKNGSSKLPGLSTNELEDFAFAEDEEKITLVRKAIKSCNAETADALVQELVDNDALPSELQLSILKVIRPFAKTDWVAGLIELKARTDPPFVRDWLRLLGATHSESAAPILLESLESKEVHTQRAALEGLAALGSKKAIPPLQRFASRLPASKLDTATDSDEYRDVLPTEEELSADALIALYNCGAPQTAMRMFDAYDSYLFNSEYLSAFFMTYRGPAKSDIQGRLLWKDMGHRLEFMRAQLHKLEDAITHIPKMQIAEFIAAASQEKRQHCIGLIYRALERSSRDLEWAFLLPLYRAEDMGISRMACSIIVELGGERASRMLSDQMKMEWRTGNRRRLLLLSRVLKKKEFSEFLELAALGEDKELARLAEYLKEKQGQNN